MLEIPLVPRRSVSLTAGSDLTTCASMSQYTGYQPNNASSGLKHWGIHEHVGRPLVDDVDWAVAPVKHQEQCGSCWTFLTTSIATGNLLTLSKQQLVDCITVDSACHDELMNNGFVFAAKNAICTEANYSYTCLATKGTCKASYCNVEPAHGSVTGYRGVPTVSEQALMSAVAQQHC